MIPQGIVRSVLGDTVSGAGEGTALIHEHISSDLSQRSGPSFLLNDRDLAVSEVSAAESDGVALIVDNGNTGHRRDPLFLFHCAQRTGVCIVASTGHYLDGFYPPPVVQASAEDIAAGMVADITAGIGGGPVRAGAIAEIGSSGEEPTAAEERVLFGLLDQVLLSSDIATKERYRSSGEAVMQRCSPHSYRGWCQPGWMTRLSTCSYAKIRSGSCSDGKE